MIIRDQRSVLASVLVGLASIVCLVKGKYNGVFTKD